jgi:hypothetical protein
MLFAACSGFSPERSAKSMAFLCAGRQETDIAVDDASTKTYLMDNGLSAGWGEADKIAVWAKKPGASSYTFENQAFGIYYLGNDATSARFTADVTTLEESSQYQYFATYPQPSSVSGSTAYFSVPATQDGNYDGTCDVMTAVPVTGASITASHTESQDVNLRMKHRMHLLKFYFEGTGMGEPVERIEATFPAAVCGTVAADFTDCSSTPSATGSTTLTLDLTTELVAGKYAYAFICPVALASSQTISFTVYSATKRATFTRSGRTFSQGCFTKVKLDLSNAQTATTIRLKVGSNHLGEVPYKTMVTSADGLSFPDGGSSYVSAGDIDAGGKIDINFWNDCSSFSNTKLNLTFESDDAIVSTSVALGTVAQQAVNVVNLDIPYLMSQDFSGLSSYEDHVTVSEKMMDSYGLAGWSECRSDGESKTAVDMKPFMSVNWPIAKFHQSRLDSPALSALKPGKTVKVTVSFNAAATRASTPMQVGSTTTTGAISADTEISNLGETVGVATVSDASYTSITGSYSATVSGVTSEARVSFRTASDTSWGNILTYNDTYIDNIKVSIAK